MDNGAAVADLGFRRAPTAMAVVELDVSDAAAPRLGRILAGNESLETLCGVESEQLAGTTLDRHVHPDDATILTSDVSALMLIDPRPQIRLIHPFWGVIWVSVVVSIADVDLTDSGASGSQTLQPKAIVALDDVTAVRQAQARLARQATHDRLTGLANREVLLTQLTRALARLTREPGSVAAIFIDLDGFKEVNDNFGHAVGDAMLVQVSKRIQQAVRGHDLVARIGGDEFAVVCDALDHHSGADAIADRIQELLAEPLSVDGTEHLIGASIGIAQSSDAGTSADDLLRQADLAMYQAKSRGRNRVEFFAARLEEQSRKRTRALDQIRRGIKHGDLSVELRPVVALGDSTVVGYECVPEMESPGLPRADALGAAARAGLLTRLDGLVLARALDWLRSGNSDQWLAISLSATKLSEVGIFDAISQQLQAVGVAPQRLVIQVGAQSLVESGKQAVRAVAALRNHGVGIALNHFGTAQSPLTSLHEFRADYLKIDASFTRGLGESRFDESIVAGIVAVTHELGGAVIADGVDTPAQADLLRKFQCDLGQGALLGRFKSGGAVL
ncbi:MAG: EAL domain-containing protein [Actinomycetia bacterium]|nr:EAL domain-containing protein [Actinomycetes bacterium]